HRGGRNRRHDGGLAARRGSAREGLVDGQRRRESGSYADRSRMRGAHRVSRGWDVAVVGSGPAGSATARLLAKAGARVLLLGRARFPREKPCSEYLSPESTRVLERLGAEVLDAVAAAAPARLTGMKVVAPSGTGVVGRFDTFSFALPRTTFDSVLRDPADAAGAVDDLGEMHVGRPGYVGLGPIGAGVTTVALVLPLAEARRGERFFDELNRFPGVAGRFDPRRIVRRVLATGPFARWSRRPAANG